MPNNTKNLIDLFLFSFNFFSLAARLPDAPVGKNNTDTKKKKMILTKVTDTNDNPPSFTKAAYSFDVPENAPRGYQVGIIAATDPDQGANADISYAVISDWANDVFSLNPQTGVVGLSSRLDYEEVISILPQNYYLSTRFDHGIPAPLLSSRYIAKIVSLWVFFIRLRFNTTFSLCKHKTAVIQASQQQLPFTAMCSI